MQNLPRIAWLVASNDEKIASIRFRALYPNAGLQALGYKTRVFWKISHLKGNLKDFDVIVIVKRLDPELIDLVSLAKDAGKKVYFDVCDNIIARDYRNALHGRNRMVFRAIAPHVDGITTTGSVLAGQISREGPFDAQRIFVVEDCVETPELIEQSSAHLGTLMHSARRTQTARIPRKRKSVSLLRALASQLGRFDAQGNLLDTRRAGSRSNSLVEITRSVAVRLYRTARYPRRTLEIINDVRHEHSVTEPSHVPVKQATKTPIRKNVVLWFGNHGGPHSDFGMLTILKMVPALRAAYALTPFTLVIVSNSISKYKAFIAKLGLRTKYVEWSHDAVQEYLDIAKVCIIPTGNDSFSKAKSANRHVLALANGVPVVAGPLASTKPLSDCISTKSWAKEISAYLNHAEKRASDLLAAESVIDKHFTYLTMGRTWNEILTSRGDCHNPKKVSIRKPKSSLLVVIDLLQDIELAIPAISAAQSAGLDVKLIISERAIRASPTLLDWLIKTKICPTFISASDSKTQDFRWIRNADAVLTLSETNQNPHKIAHYVTKLANSINVPTFTVQHGFENIGLTYRDAEYPDVSIASETIFTWADPNELPSWVAQETRQKSIATGRIKPMIKKRKSRSKLSQNDYDSIVGVFENLHWSRYSAKYKEQFCLSLVETAKRLPRTLFVVKTHPAGKWIEKRASVELWPTNLVLQNQDQKWRSMNADQTIHHLDAVISTPSTIAVDAAEQGKAIAIVGGNGCDVQSYAPLPVLEHATDWVDFCNDAVQNGSSGVYPTTTAFLDRAISDVNGTRSIIDRILNELASQST